MSISNILISPRARDPFEIPKVPLMDYVFKHLRAKMPTLKNKVWLETVDTGERIKFEEVEDSVKRYASALTKLGFKKGDLLFYCTYNVNHLHLIRFAVWLLGGITKGIYPKESKEFNVINLKATPPTIILIDGDTHDDICDAMLEINVSVPVISFGNVDGAIPVQTLLNDDGLGLPDKIEIDPKNDIFCYVLTSGSTGPPKIIPHTSYSFVAVLQHFPVDAHGEKMLSQGSNSGIASILPSLHTLMNGTTLLRAAHFDKNSLIKWIGKHKPDTILLYTFLANWFANTVREMNLDFSFLKNISVGGAAVNTNTIEILAKSFPHSKIMQGYGMSEFTSIAGTRLDKTMNVPKFYKLDGKEYPTCGKLLPYNKLKIVNPESGKVLGANEQGEIYVKSPTSFLGYYDPDTGEINKNCFDSDGWFRTSDIGFYDDEFNVYVIGRWSFLFKFRAKIISPIEIESCLNKHHAVLCCAVVPIPDVDNDNLARAYVTLAPGKEVTEKDLIHYVAQRLEFYKHLHGGVRFIDKIPENQNGKIDRNALKQMALADNA